MCSAYPVECINGCSDRCERSSSTFQLPGDGGRRDAIGCALDLGAAPLRDSDRRWRMRDDNRRF